MLRDKLKNLKLRQRMLLVYAIGCLLPLLFIVVFMINSSRNTLISMEIADEKQKMNTVKEELEEAMDRSVDLSERMFFDSMLQMIGISPVAEEDTLLFDFRDFDHLMNYARQNVGSISSISIYVNPGTVERVDNRRFRLITDTIREKEWYKNTIAAAGLPSWSYLTDFATGRRSIRLTRILYSRTTREEIGIISISLDPALTEDFVLEMEGFTVMTLNDRSIVHANFDITEEEAALLLSKSEASENNTRIRFRGFVCALTEIRITPRTSTDYYEILTARPLGDIDAAVRGNMRSTVIPLILAALVMLLAIFLFNSWFTKRITALGYAMHNVTMKKYDAAEDVIGDAKDEIWELYNDMNHMVTDMQELSEAAANERIQKELIYSRQRDVEFKMLTTQINPHFLYNTLENIRMLAVINHENEIEDISVRLTRLLRSSLEAGSELKTLAWEMDKVDCYIGIQDYRFGDRISASIEYDPEQAEQVMIMPFLIQPFVENAYVHAMEEMDEGGQILIRAEIGKTLDIIIQDNGRGMSREELTRILSSMNDVEELDRTHIGVANVNQRIRLRFGEAYGVTFTSEEGKGTTVKLHMPLIRKNEVSPPGKEE